MTDNFNKKIYEWEKKTNKISSISVNTEKKFSSLSAYNKEFVEFLIDFYHLSDKNILDYGCGSGFIANLFSNYSQNVSACDFSIDLLNYAKKHCNNSINFFEDDFFKSELKNDSYDFIFCRGLGPLQKIDYSEENSRYVKKIISSLNNDGIAYFTLLSNLSGISGNRITGFQNYQLQTIYDFFSQAGFVSMINVFGRQAIIVTKSKEAGIKFNNKMYSAVNKMLENLQGFDGVGYVKCRLWLYVNSTEDQIPLKDFEYVENYLRKKIFNTLVKGLCSQSYQNTDQTYTKPLYFVAGDTDKYYERLFTEQLFRNNIVKKAPKWIKRKFFSK